MSLPPLERNEEKQVMPTTLDSCLQLGPPSSFDDISKAPRGTSPPTTTISSAPTFSPLSQQLAEQLKAEQTPGDATAAPPDTSWKLEDAHKLVQIITLMRLKYVELRWDEIATDFNDGKRQYRTKSALRNKYGRLCRKDQSVASTTPMMSNPHNSMERS
jgi:hypothetical protein